MNYVFRVHEVLVTASNELSTVKVTCHMVVLPRVNYISAGIVGITASYYMQLNAVIPADSGMSCYPCQLAPVWTCSPALVDCFFMRLIDMLLFCEIC